jgi:hypothetical protein
MVVAAVHAAGGILADAFAATHAALAPRYGGGRSSSTACRFNVSRLWDELDGVDWPWIWTAERYREVWGAAGRSL